VPRASASLEAEKKWRWSPPSTAVLATANDSCGFAAGVCLLGELNDLEGGGMTDAGLIGLGGALERIS